MSDRYAAALWLAWIICFAPAAINAQQADPKVIRIARTNEKMVVDGLDRESSWSGASRTDAFINKWPLDTGRARLQSEVRLLYDDRYLYVFARMEVRDNHPVIQSLKRDVNPYYSEGFSIVLDPSGQKASGFTFGVNADGAQFDGIVQYNSASFEADAKWFSATRRYDSGWTAEMAIPFKSLRFPSGRSSWGINFIRNDMTNNCFSTWNRVPLQYFGANLGCLGEGIFEGLPGKVSGTSSFIPYVNTGFSHDSLSRSHLQAGLDLRIPISSSLNLAATLHPDFSQVDIDQQLINLDRYSLLLPEKRVFFLENSDIYTNLGSAGIRPYFSRRIGLTEDGKAINLAAGARLNGNIDTRTRLEIMDMQSGKKQDGTRQNYFFAVMERQVLKRSNLRFYAVNSQLFGDSALKAANVDRYNRVGGLEFAYVNPGGSLDISARLSGAFTPARQGDNLFTNLGLHYYSPRVILSTELNEIGKNYIAALGFTPRLYNFDAATNRTVRLGYYEHTSHIEYDIYPKSKRLINMQVLELNPSLFFNRADGSLNEADLPFRYSVQFANRRSFYAGWVQKFIRLPFTTKIFNDLNTFQARLYRFGYFEMNYASNFLKPFSWNLTSELGSYFNGRRLSLAAGLKERLQPWGNFGVSLNYNHITVEGKSIDPLIITPSMELAFTKDLFLTTFAQYNTDISNVNFNGRFEWRFRPLSELFLVYASNYHTPGYQQQNAGLTLKLVWWLN